MKQWKRLAALSSAIVMAAATLTYFPNDTLQNIRLELSASAETTTEPQVWNEDNLTWKLDADGTLTISGTGTMKDYNSSDNLSPVYSNSKIKKVVIEKGVTSIGESAFENCSNLTSITIPGSVTSIGNFAFCICTGLTSITIPDGVTSIGNSAFSFCRSLTSITIPDSVTSIGSYAFYDCSSLTSITIPDSVTSIGAMAFVSCTNLQTISLSCKSSLKKSDFGDQADLVSASHTLKKTEAKDATCSESGNKEYWTCEHCGKYFLSDDTNPETAKAVEQSETIIPASHKLTKVDAKAPTCTEDGNKEYWTCKHCGKYFLSDDTNPETAKAVEQSEFIISASHKLTKVEAKDATCAENGNKEYWTCEHCGKYFLSDDTNPETAKAVEQSETIIPAIQHKNAELLNASEPIETAPGYSGDLYCPDCDKVVEKGYTYWNEDNLTWKLYADGTLTISGTGTMENYNDTDNLSPACRNSSIKKVVIEDGVTSIGNSVFDSCSNLASITIPSSVTSIGNYAFWGCKNLPSITIPDSVTSIGKSAFSNCSSLTSITIPDGVTSIGNYAFSSCRKLTSITIPDSVTSIGESAFAACSSLTSITIPDSVTSIGKSAFSNCSSLTSITIPDSVTSIGNSAFSGCKNLTSITIPDSIISIGNNVFYNCSSLTSITIPDSVTSIGDFAFYNCSGLTSITIPDSVTSIGNRAFENCSSLTSITIPDGVTSIGDSTFKGCSSLTAISLSCGSALKKSDFGNQANLVSYTNQHLLTKTAAKAATCSESGNKEYWTCEHCKKYFLSDDTNPETAKAIELSETVIPASHKLTKVEAKDATCSENGNKEYWTCEHCKKYFLSDDANPATATAVEQSETVIPAIQHKNAELRNASEPTETSPGYSGDLYCPDCDKVVEKGYTYWNEDNLTWKLDADGTLTISGTGAMKDYNYHGNRSPVCKNSNVKKVVIEDGVTSIGEDAFYYCESLTSITIPDSVTSIGNGAFSYTGLKSITIPDSVTSIGNYAFRNCSSLTSITIPDSVTSIGTATFFGCKNLTSITIPDSVTSIGESAFAYCSSLTSITIPDSVTSIGEAAFSNCWYLTNITIPDSVTSIGEYAFQSCSRLTSITIPDGVTSIGMYAFSGCIRLTSITIPDGVTSIGKYAFSGCISLTSITIPDSVTSIGERAFAGCESLTSITIPDSVTSIGTEVFQKCTSLQTISLSCKSSLKKDDFGDQADLVSYTNQHLLTKTAAKAATCTEDGNKEYWTCEHCGKYFLSDDANPETAKAVELSETVIPASHKLTKVEAKDATCAENGNKAYWTCEHCKKYFLSDDTNPETAKAVELSETILPAIQHKNAELRNASEPTETAPGYSGDLYCPDCDTVFEKGYTYWNEDNLTWTLDADGTLTISGTGAMKDYDYYNNPSPASQKKDSVKKVVIEDGVTSIRNSAFYDCNSLTSITIPNSVTSIGAYAFSNCYYLTNITIPNSVTSIENYAFRSCSSLTSITIPDSVTSIGELAFYSCDRLTSITISNSVTSIGERAFAYCSRLNSITIPDSVTSIGEAAFAGCSSLTSITIPDSVTSIGEYAFQSCSSLTSITIPDSVTSIGDYVFISCSSLTTISLSCKSSLKRSDFGGQADLVSYTLHTLKKTEAKAATCTEDGNKEYWTCEHCGKYFLSDDTNPETAKAVEQSETVIPASHKLTKVEAKDATCTEDGNKEYWTCEHCKKYFLSDDTNPETAKAVELSETILPAIQHKNAELRNSSEPTETAPGYSGDLYCPDCDKVVEKGYTYWNEGNLTWKLYEDGTLNISGTGAMKDYNDDDNPSPVYQNSNVKKVVIEKGVTSIGNYAFSGCLGLKSITIPDGITSIGDHAFDSCINLRSITLPDSITSIGMWAFYNCWNVSSIIIPDGVTSIEDFTFNSCISLTSITIPNSVTNIKSSAFHNCADLTSITIPDSVTSIGYAAFSNCDSLQTISLSCGSALKKSDFGDQADLVSYTNQHLLTKTEAKAKTCTEDGNKEYWTCEHCGKYFLSDDTNPETAKAVEQSETIIPASHKLTKVKEEKAPTCTEDGNKEYWTCEHCGKYFLSDDTNPETAKAVELSETILPAIQHKNAELRNASEPTETSPGYSGDLYCPDCDKVLEKGYTYWNEGNLTWKLDADGTLTISGKGAMKDYDIENNESPVFKNLNVKKIVIEDGVTNIGNCAFDCCTGLTSITIPDSVTSIGNDALQGCTNLTSITIPDSVTSIGAHAFSNCYKLISITLPSSITSIGEWVFAGCYDLTSITIPDSVTSIGDYAFYSCYQLTSITLSSNITRIGDDAFGYCSDLISITIPDSVTSIGSFAFNHCNSLQTISLGCGSALKRSDFGKQGDFVSYASHILKKTAAKDATCTEDGNKEYWTCEHCGKYFLSDDTNPETAKAVEQSETVIPASHELTKVEAKAATCTEDGNIAYWQCDVCKKTFTDEAGKNAVDNVIIPALKHSYNENGFCENDDTHYQPATYNEEIEKYEISNAGQLYWFAEQVNSGNASVNAVLTTDIVVNEGNLATYDGTSPNTWMTWTPIGNAISRRVYSGTFDGQGHTISGLYVNSNDNYIGLFGVVMSGSNIKNIGVINSYFKGNDFVGGIAGAVNESSFVQNCYSINTISGNDYIGGICGMFGSNNTSVKKCYSICDIHPSEKATHVGGVIASGEYVNISDCYYDSDIFSGKAYTDIFSSVNAKNVEGKTTAQFASGEVTYLLNDDQSNIIFYQDLATEKYPTLNQKSKVVMQLEMIYDESFGEDATTNKTYHNAGDTIALETSPDKAYTYQYFVDEKQIEEPTYTLTGNKKMTVKSVPVEIELSEIDTIQLTYQKKMMLDLTAYIKNFADLKPMQFQLDADSKLPEGLTLAENGILSGIPEKAAENVKTTLILTAKNGTTKNMELTFHIAKADPTVEVSVSGDSHTEGDLVGELELILSENSTKGVVELVSEIKALVAGKNTLTWKFTPEDENNYNMVTGTVVVNAKATTTTTTTTTKATTTTTKATTTTKPNKTTTTKATTTTAKATTKPSKTTTTKVTTTTKPSKTTTTKVTTTTKPSKTTTTKATTTTKPNKTTTTKVTTTTKPSKTTTTKVTTTTKPSKTTTTKATTTTKPSKTTTTKVTTTTKPSKTTTTKVTTTTKPSKTTTTKATTTTKPNKTTTTKATITTKPSKKTTTNATTTTKPSKTTTTNATTTTKPNKTTTTNATTTTKPSKTTTTNATTTNTAIPSYGDVNLDGKVDILDAVFLNKYLATLVQFSDVQIANADCYQDGVLNAQDTTALMQFIILLIDNLPV